MVEASIRTPSIHRIAKRIPIGTVPACQSIILLCLNLGLFLTLYPAGNTPPLSAYTPILFVMSVFEVLVIDFTHVFDTQLFHVDEWSFQSELSHISS